MNGILPNTPSTIAFSDLYGGSPPGMDTTPAERDSVEASGDYVTKFDMARPAVFWVALVGALVAIRLLYEWGGK